MRTVVSFTIVEGPDEGAWHEIRKREIHIGSDFSSDLILNHPDVAPNHFRILEEGTDELYIEDLDGTSGVKLNGLFVSREPLHNGDELQAGPYVFHVSLAKEEIPEEEIQEYVETDQRSRPSITFGKKPKWVPLIFLLVFGVYILLRGGGGQEEEKPDLSTLGPVPLPSEGVYGYKVDGKNYVDKAEFTFVPNQPKYRLRYRPGYINRPGIARIFINDQRLEDVPVTINRWAEEPTVVEIPQRYLKLGQTNTIRFENLRYPERGNTKVKWGIRDVSVEEVPIPKCDVDVAQKYFRLANEKYEEKRINDPNLYQAVSYLREGLEYVIACDDAQMRNLLLDTMAQFEQELQRKYDANIFNAKKFVKLKDFRSAVYELEQVLRFIPDKADKRHKRAKDFLERLTKAMRKK